MMPEWWVPFVALPLGGSLLFGLLPVFATKLIVRLYPSDHPRRLELVAELLTIPFHERLLWVMQCLGLAITEGLTERSRARRAQGKPGWIRCSIGIAVAATLVVVLLPMLLVISLVIKLSSRGPVMVSAPLVGSDGVTVSRLRFRTRSFDHEERQSRFGHFLVRTSLAEVPLVLTAASGGATVPFTEMLEQMLTRDAWRILLWGPGRKPPEDD